MEVFFAQTLKRNLQDEAKYMLQPKMYFLEVFVEFCKVSRRQFEESFHELNVKPKKSINPISLFLLLSFI